MKIAFYVYPTAFQSPGGGEVQLLKTKEYLEKEAANENIEVRLFDPWRDKLKDFDILHTFGSVKDCLPMMLAAEQAGIKNALSTICWYSWTSAFGTYGTFTQKGLSVGRQLAKCFFPFLPSERKKMMQCADILFPNSQSEADQLSRYFCISKEKIFTVPNGVDSSFASASPDPFIKKYGFQDFILCVGRIEPRKNQLNMIRALNGSGKTFVLIGDPVPHYPDYYEECRKSADGNTHFLGHVPHESGLLASAYAACNTFLLASWLETPGLAALEAALAGAKVVITSEGATREYFAEHAAYVSPNQLSDIKEKTLAVFSKPKDARLKEHVLQHYSWKQVALKTLEGYKSLLKAK